MECLAVIGVPAIIAWGISVDYRCISESVQKWLKVIVTAMVIWLIAAILIGGTVLIAALVSNLYLALIIEVLLAANIIPSARSIRSLFPFLPFDLRIIAFGGKEVYRTNVARKLDNTTMWGQASAAKREKRGTVTNVRLSSFQDVVFKRYRLQAGIALIAEDISELDNLKRALERQRDNLADQNRLIMRNQAMQGILYRQDRERELCDRVEHDLAATAEQIREILDGQLTDEGPASQQERVEQLNYVKVLVAYCKRKGMLALHGAESDVMGAQQLDLIAREAMADLRSIGIECAVLVAVDKPLSVNAVNTIYDSFYDCVLSVLPRTRPVIMVYLSIDEQGYLCMRASIECAIGLDSETAVETIPKIATSTEPWTAVQAGIAEDLASRLALRDADFAIGLEDGLVSVTVRASDTLLAEEGGRP